MEAGSTEEVAADFMDAKVPRLIKVRGQGFSPLAIRSKEEL